ncbi:MAG: RNA methyltransferase [Ruminiclostridium sp.]|nr:RNA methyltransferase [Ruminiclostridium sp.]
MIISSRKNPALARYRELDRDRKCRERERMFNIEGVRLCTEAVNAGVRIVSAFVTESAVTKYPEAYSALCAVCTPTVIADDLGSYISDTKTPQGLFVTAQMLDNSGKMSKIECGRYILLDGLQDAGNIGTILRTAEALGMSGAVLSPDCADIYSPKVVRGAMGSLFRLPTAVTPLPEFIEELRGDGYTVYAAILDSSAKSLYETDFPEKCAVVIGNEGNGVSRGVINACDSGIYIPIEGAESLNAAIAAAIFCAEIKRQKTVGN